jgi:hypothetical protein
MIADSDLDLSLDQGSFLERDHTFHLHVADRRAGAARAWVERVRYRPDGVEVVSAGGGAAEVRATYRAGTPRGIVRAVASALAEIEQAHC